MAKDFESLKQQALLIKNEVDDGANTAERIGGILEDILDFDNEKLTELDSRVSIDINSLPEKGKYYDSVTASVGSIYIPKILNAGDDYNCGKYFVSANSSIIVKSLIFGEVAHTVITDTQYNIIEKIATSDFERKYEKDVYIFITANTKDSRSANFRLVIDRYEDLRNQTMTSNEILTAEKFIYHKKYISDGYIQNTKRGILTEECLTTNSQWYSTLLYINKGGSVHFESVTSSDDTKYFYILDKNFNIINKPLKKSTPFIEASDYDIIVAFSTENYQGTRVIIKNKANQLQITNAEINLNKCDLNYANGYLSLSGGEAVSSGFIVSDYINIEQLNELYFDLSIFNYFEDNGVAYRLCYYNAQKEFISGIHTSEMIGQRNSINSIMLEKPEDAFYYRIFSEKLKPVFELREYVQDVSEYKFKLKINWIKGAYFGTNIQEIPNDGWRISNLIHLDPNNKYYIKGKLVGGGAGVIIVSYYDKYKRYITGTISYSSQSFDEELSRPDGAEYIKLCDTVNNSDEIQILSANYQTEEKLYGTVDIVVPRYIDCPINRQTDIFLDGILAEPDDAKIHPTDIYNLFTSNIIVIDRNHLRYTPNDESDNESVIIRKYNDANLTDLNNIKGLNFRVIKTNVGSKEEKNICICGDSLIDGTNAPCEMYKLLKEDNDFTINQIGTKDAVMDDITYKHEGRGGWTWSMYLNPEYENGVPGASGGVSSSPNAFMKNGVLDFQAYINDNFPDLSNKTIDIFGIALGTNDITQGSTIPSGEGIDSIINNAKEFINALLSEDKGFPNCKVFIGLIGVGAPSFGYSNVSASIFKMAALKLNRAYVDTFDNGNYHPNVTCVMHGAYIDRYNSYPYEDTNISDYVNEKVRRYTNSVHPLPIGYKQWGRGYYGKVRAFLDGKL